MFHREMSAMANDQENAPIEEEQPPAESAATGEAGGEPAATADPQVAALTEQLAAAQQQVADATLRGQAELENLRKRTARDLENAHKFALERFAQELLPVRDSLELGIDAARQAGGDGFEKLIEGSELTLKMLSAAMEKFGIVEIAAEGERFNPDLHQAMSMLPADGVESGTIVTVYQKGYTLNERLMRPAMVIVAQ